MDFINSINDCLRYYRKNLVTLDHVLGYCQCAYDLGYLTKEELLFIVRNIERIEVK